jgi:hypothetical protein
VPTKEKVTVKEQKGATFTLAWTTEEQGNPEGAPTSIGTIAFQETTSGLVNVDWSSNAPPAAFPILCAAASSCNNSIASTYYSLIWGSRAPVVTAPLLVGSKWTSRGGAQGDVTSVSDYVGMEPVTVPAFSQPVMAAKVRSEVTQAGALGDPFGSGVRTVWWVYGVGPVKVVFEHAGGSAPVTTSVLASTNLAPKAAPSDVRYLPFVRGSSARFRWTNSKHMKKPSVQVVTVDEVLNESARLSVKHVSGPIRVAGSYGFTTRADGITSLWGSTQSATIAPLPALGPGRLPKDRRRRFSTPIDLMTFGLNPVIPAHPAPGISWSVKTPSRDFSVYGVTGSTTVVGTQSVTVPAGRFTALVVRSTLVQQGFKFGSGTRTSYFAPGKGLVKLVFRHADGSVSTVERLG